MTRLAGDEPRRGRRLPTGAAEQSAAAAAAAAAPAPMAPAKATPKDTK